MIVVAIALLIAAAAAVYVTHLFAQKTFNVMVQAYENSLAWERTRVDNLLVQVQANSQGMQHYPTYGPAPTEPVVDRLLDDYGFDAPFEPSTDERDFVEAANL